MRRFLACIALLLATGCTSVEAERPGAIISSGGALLTEPEMVAALARAQIVILGEVHDNPVHHARQARLVRQLRPRGIAFEMVPEASEEGIQVFLAQGGARSEIGPAIGWDRIGWPDWELYAPVFEAAAGAYVAGGGVARPEIRTAIEGNAATAYGAGAGDLGLDRPLDPAIRIEIEDEMIAAHCNKLPRRAAGGMVEAQRLRDASFAIAVRRALAMGGGDLAVLITGNGHARTDRGVPAYLSVVAPDLAVLSVGMIELNPGADPIAAAHGLPFDYVWLSDPAKRPDPCAGFG
ncbi:MAG: ChaN family lipoprotein [Alphaproteobacteria bacterium]